jgi:hypothetical protein
VNEKNVLVAGTSQTPRYDALLKESNEEAARFCATHGTLRVWEALEAAERELAKMERDRDEQRSAVGALTEDNVHLADEFARIEQYAEQLRGALQRVKYELGNYADVIDGNEGRQLPNLAMELETLLLPHIDAALAGTGLV